MGKNSCLKPYTPFMDCKKTIKFNKIVVDRAIYRPKIFQNSTKLVHNKEDSYNDDK